MPQPTTIHLAGDGLTLTADVLGPDDGPPILMFHGGGQTRHSWGGAQRRLAAEGWWVASVDLRGHGDSEWAPDGDYRLEAFAADIAALARRYDRPVLIGASLGGVSSLTALGAPGNDDLARGLVLVDIAPRIETSGAERIGQFMMQHLSDGFASLDEVADAIQSYNPHRPRPANLDGLRKNVRWRDGRWFWHWDPAFVLGGMGSADETRVSQGFRRHHDLLDDAARSLTIPTLLVRGRESDLLSEEGARQFLALVPHARFVDVAGAGHMVAGDRNDAFNEAILGFVDDLR